MSRICIVVGEFYQDIAAELVKGATTYLDEIKVEYDVIGVPGAFEIPSAVNMAIVSGKYSGYVALGCVIRGETTHYDYVCQESARGLNQIAIDNIEAIGYGILTVETSEQAWVRAAVTQGNKGKHAAIACMRLLEIAKNFGIDSQGE